MNKLYDIVFSTKEDRKLLYFKGNADVNEQGLHISSGNTVDFLTYFNSFSITKWKEYTTIKKVQINGKIIGSAEIEIYTVGKEEKVLTKKQVNGSFALDFDVEKITGEILGIKVKAESKVIIQNLTYLGEFEEWKNQKIGVIICTFKREQYAKVTIDKLVQFSKNNPWLTTLVVDNGSTLEKVETDNLRIIHNPNYGGSGGFTRGLIENLKSKTNDYVLLMDDDIDLEPSALAHTYGLLCGLKDEYKESFLSGAMLRMHAPYIQHENTAYWGKIRLHSIGKGWNLTDNQVLLNNERIQNYDNQYGAWWYCCIPLKRVSEIGLPLPAFVKGDDIEYGLRNERKLIHLNGIGVWHEAFEGKQALWVDYFAYRNFFIMNHYAKGCNRWTLLAMILGRMTVHFIKGHFNETKILTLALKDAMGGFEKITELPADEKLRQIREYKPYNKYILAVFNNIKIAINCLANYNNINKKYIGFRKRQLNNSNFWLKYLNKSKG